MARRSPPAQQMMAMDGDAPDGALSPQGGPRREVFDPFVLHTSLRSLIDDPVFFAIENLFRDRQQYGRLAYEVAHQHEVVGAAFEARLAILMSKKPKFKARAKDPTPTQKDAVDFANHMVESMDWVRFIDGVIGQGLEFGFSLSEIVTRYGMWKGNLAVFLDHLAPLPQASLDTGFVSRQEFNMVNVSADARYRCFVMDPKGRITAYRQFAYNGSRERSITWEGAQMKRILHYRHRGGDGNPCGQSALYHTMSAWSSLYALERMEDAFLDTALPWLFGTYKTTAGEVRKAVHDQATDALEKAYVDAAHRFLMWGDGDLKSVAPSNENFTDHVFRRKAELEGRIWWTLLPKPLVAPSEDSDLNTRHVVQVYFKHGIKADLEEIGTLLTDLLRRILGENYSNLRPEDIPLCTWSLVTENEMRVAQSILLAALPHARSDTLGEFVHSLFDFVDPRFIAATHGESVEVKRPRRDVDDEPDSVLGDPPPKEEGEVRERVDGQTENPSGTSSTEA